MLSAGREICDFSGWSTGCSCWRGSTACLRKKGQHRRTHAKSAGTISMERNRKELDRLLLLFCTKGKENPAIVGTLLRTDEGRSCS